MQAERWAQIEAIFQSAVDCAPENRVALLDSACGEDAELRREVESLLNTNDDSWTQSSAWREAFRILERRHAKLCEGRRIGAYRVVGELGRGGMGSVYLCARADDEFQKLVAIKVIRRGLDTDDIVCRFRSERQILATLDHPNVTRLLDGGTTDDGLPFFVMEYIEGEPIDKYCEGRNLSVAERLRLFQDVCSAVSYAHQHLIVHRDIKPENVLVTKQGIPRLLDFGIAKLLSPEPAAQEKTQTGLRPLTPEYASPEQVRGEPVTTASDTYSLGILLYRLLTGHRPYRSEMSSPSEVEHAISSEEPDKPSERAPAFRRHLKGDLDTIILMALRKEPRRRYATVEQFSEDLRRHLANLPIAARPDTRFYRTTKFIQRNKAGVAAVTLVFLMLTGGIAATLWQARVARLEQAKAARINAFLQEMVGYSGVFGGSANQSHDATVADMLDDAARRVETELEGQPEVKAEMLGTIGGTYVTQARYDLAARYLREAYDLNLRLYGRQSRQIALIMHGLANLAYLKGDYATADSWFERAVPNYRRHVNDANFEFSPFVAMLSDAAFVKRALGRTDLAEALWREALNYGPRLPQRYHAQSIAPKTFLAQLYLDRGDIESADRLASEASQELRAYGANRFSLAQSLIDLGNVRRLEKRYPEADALIQEGTSLYAQAQGNDHPNVAYGLASLAMSRCDQGKYDLAEQGARAAVKIVEKLPQGHYRVRAYSTLGVILNKMGRWQEAETLLREALGAREQTSPRESNAVALAVGSLGECLTAQKRYDEAEPLLLESYQTLKTLNVPQSPFLNEARTRLFKLYTGWDRVPESRLYAP